VSPEGPDSFLPYPELTKAINKRPFCEYNEALIPQPK
jgi:hypothetical protein